VTNQGGPTKDGGFILDDSELEPPSPEELRREWSKEPETPEETLAPAAARGYKASPNRTEPPMPLTLPQLERHLFAAAVILSPGFVAPHLGAVAR
jgi:hypothetical protein